MRRIHNLILAGLVGVGVSACQPDTVINVPALPTAGVRFINAVPDTAGAFGMDLRWLDIVENNDLYRITFRNGPSSSAPFVSQTAQYKGALAGSRHFKIFFDDTLPAVASVVVIDTTVTLAGDVNYTAMLWGNARSTGANKMHLTFMTDDIGGNKDTTLVGFRVINADSLPIDVTLYLKGATPSATPTWAAVPGYSASSYVFVAPASYTTAASNTYMYSVSRGGVALFTDAAAMTGSPANCDLHYPCLPGEQPDVEAAPGAAVAGSAISAMVFPRSVAGSRAASFTTPGITFTWDRRPPKGCKPTLC